MRTLKFVALIFVLVVVVPLLAKKASESDLLRKILVGLIAFDLFNPADLNIISDENYRGDSRGIEVTTVDLMILAVFFAQRLRRDPLTTGKRFIVARLLYLGVVLLSLSASPELLRSLFSVWKLLRMFFAFEVLCTAFLEMQLVSAATYGLAAGVLSQGLLALQQKYVHHMMRVVGSQSHPNSLAMIVNLISPIAFALLLSGRGKMVTIPVVAFAALCNVFSLSRGGMMMFVVAMSMVFAGSLAKRVTGRKLLVLLGAVAAVAAVLIKSADTIYERFTEAPASSEEARHLFNQAAEAMADEHVFGIGINMYSHVLDKGGYADRFGIYEGDRSGIAHHIYWLTSAELGYVGLVAYLVLLLTVLAYAFRGARLKGVYGDLCLGIAAGLTVTYIQGTAEWILRQTNFSYAFWLLAALVASSRRWPRNDASPG